MRAATATWARNKENSMSEEPEVIAPVVEPQEPTPAPEPTPIEPEPTVPLSAQKAERRKRQEAEKEAAYWRGVAEGGGKKVESKPAVVETGPPAPPPRPARLNSANFDTWDAFEDAQAKLNEEYQTKREEYVAAKVKYEVAQERKAETHGQTQNQKAEEYRKRLAKAVESDPEIQDIANNWNVPGQYQLPLNATMQDAILESDVGPEMLRHLHNNKADAARIARLSPVAAVRELVKIENEILDKSKTQPPKVSNAPPPITPLSTKGAVNVDDDHRPAKDVIAEYRRQSAGR
jgi:hypothetical protein